jgi:putative protease
MICDHDLPGMSLPHAHFLDNPEVYDRRYALLDKAGEKHSLRLDQYGRNHILFAKDLCLYPYLGKFNGIASYRLEAQDYSPELTAQVTKAYRESLDKLSKGQEHFDGDVLEKLQQNSHREFGLGTYRFRQSRDSI